MPASEVILMNTKHATDSIHRDPLGLGDLPLLDPGKDGWPEIRQALEAHLAQKRRRRVAAGWLAMAASIVLAVVVTTRQMDPVDSGLQPGLPNVVTESAAVASGEQEQTIDSLISLSSTLESRLRSLRNGSASMPASSAVYVAELEDLVAQVDSQLSMEPGSVTLWGQRVNLLLDLAQIYQHQWEVDYGQMASL